MLLDCVIVGGGPAGLNASLVLARAKKKIVLFDEDKPRNAVTYESHGFITRDRIKPSEFKRLAKEELEEYPSIEIQNQRVTDIQKEEGTFLVYANDGNSYRTRKVILATGLTDVLPDIKGIHEFYGMSLFSCPFCDGWELRDRPLVVVAEDERAMHGVKLIANWSKDLVVCTNGKTPFTAEQSELLLKKNIRVIDKEIESFQGDKGQLKIIRFKGGEELEREGGFVASELKQASSLIESLGCSLNTMGGVETDDFGRTEVEGVYACGDNALVAPAQLVIAASEGSRTAIGVVADLVNEDF
ncbi:NAD(P)/FAD-dependent oxidoreductase [Sediminibacillus halophilus]|uniref:Thioredoxin reductase n=1 Tax=Sediminibacillus halophilus TaxID=482461 RepID=A0A1G9V3T7_9BACI|nr:NAD(P)/FAD-dependent oxidoreductase [Sediminibacillus halophilus]SDM66874.1 Thioredoxin reductase [Sediminibacillus halophilus]